MSYSARGWLYDGKSGVRHDVTVHLEATGLRIDEREETVPFASLRARGDQRSAAFGRTDIEGWRLTFPDGVPERWRDALPRQEKHGGIIDSLGLGKALAICGIASALLLIGLWRGAEIVAHLVPERWEIALGDSMIGDLGAMRCDRAAGQRALDGLAGRLSPGEAATKVRVVHLDMINAVALPGRNVLIFDGLLKEAKSPDELAGVLGHELGHVANRDVMAGVIRGFGLSLLIGGADGGAIMQSLIASRYSRTTERSADGEALARLDRAGISPAPTARFFDRLGKREETLGGAEKVLGWMASHPLSADREQRFTDAARDGAAYRPALSAAEWSAVRRMCADKRDE